MDTVLLFAASMVVVLIVVLVFFRGARSAAAPVESQSTRETQRLSHVCRCGVCNRLCQPAATLGPKGVMTR